MALPLLTRPSTACKVYALGSAHAVQQSTRSYTRVRARGVKSIQGERVLWLKGWSRDPRSQTCITPLAQPSFPGTRNLILDPKPSRANWLHGLGEVASGFTGSEVTTPRFVHRQEQRHLAAGGLEQLRVRVKPTREGSMLLCGH